MCMYYGIDSIVISQYSNKLLRKIDGVHSNNNSDIYQHHVVQSIYLGNAYYTYDTSM